MLYVFRIVPPAIIAERTSQTFINNAHVGVDVDAQQIRQHHDATVIATGATWPRDLKIPGRDADGIHFAMEFLQVSLSAVLIVVRRVHTLIQ